MDGKMLACMEIKSIFIDFQKSMETRLRKTIHSLVRLMDKIVKPIKVKLSLMPENTDS